MGKTPLCCKRGVVGSLPTGGASKKKGGGVAPAPYPHLDFFLFMVDRYCSDAIIHTWQVNLAPGLVLLVLHPLFLCHSIGDASRMTC